jgi:hypothetical protein
MIYIASKLSVEATWVAYRSRSVIPGTIIVQAPDSICCYLHIVCICVYKLVFCFITEVRFTCLIMIIFYTGTVVFICLNGSEQ